MSDYVRGCLVALAGCAVAAGAAWGQTCPAMGGWPCPDTTACAPTISSASHRGPGEVWYPPMSGETLHADRRPMTAVFGWWHALGYDHNPFGMDPGWWSGYSCPHSSDDCPIDVDGNGRPDQFDWLLQQFDAAYARGYRRINFYLPHGGVYPLQNVPSSQWWVMPPWRRYWLSRSADVPGTPGGLAWWINAHRDVAHPANDIEVSLYCGYPINDPCEPCYTSNSTDELKYTGGLYYWPCHDAAPSHVPLTTSTADTLTVRRNVQPWLDLGMKMVWFDASAGPVHRYELVQFAWSPDYQPAGVKFGGEGFPLVVDPVTHRGYPDPAVFVGAPWLILLDTAEWSDANGRTTLADQTAHFWQMPAGWEGVIWPTTVPNLNHEGQSGVTRPDWIPTLRYETMYDAYVAKGFTLVEGFEYAERIFGFGQIREGADFNGDGVVNSSDMFDLLTRQSVSADYIGRHPTGGKQLTFYHGDFNNDGVINSQDFFDFLSYFNTYIDPQHPHPLNLGNIRWDPNSTWIPTRDEWLHN